MRGVCRLGERKLDKDDPIVIDLVQRVSRLEERTNSLERSVEYLKQRIELLDSKMWWVLGGVILSILIQILFHVIR
jgi:hypothetical protein